MLKIERNYIDRDRDKLLAQAMHLFDRGYDLREGEALPPFDFNGASRALLSDFWEPDFMPVVAIDGGEDVVSVAAYSRFDRMAGAASLDRLVTHPMARRRGIGARMLEYMARRARTDGRNQLRFIARSWDLVPYYERNGCRVGQFVTPLDENPDMYLDVSSAKILEPQEAVSV